MGDTDDVLYGISADAICRATGVSQATAFRYKSGGKIPKPIQNLIQIMIHGDLGLVDKSFAGWVIKKGKLFTPNDDAFTPTQIQGIPFRTAQLAHLQSEARFQRQADWVDEKFIINEIAKEA